jgi:16S rRNA (cytidine1402-2'-O)-methyltransferase
LSESLEDALTILGSDRRIALCREMTKTYEEVVRGTIGELLEWSRGKEVLGEITLVLEGFDPNNQRYADDELISMVKARESMGETRKEAIAEVAKDAGVPKRAVFDLMVGSKRS